MNLIEEEINKINSKKIENNGLPLELWYYLFHLETVNKFLKDTNLENYVVINDNLINFKIPTRKIIRKYLDKLLELEGCFLKDKIISLPKNEIVDFILIQSQKNFYNIEPNNAWQLKNIIKKFKSSSIPIYDCCKMIIYIYASKDKYKFDMAKAIQVEVNRL